MPQSDRVADTSQARSSDMVGTIMASMTALYADAEANPQEPVTEKQTSNSTPKDSGSKSSTGGKQRENVALRRLPATA